MITYSSVPTQGGWGGLAKMQSRAAPTSGLIQGRAACLPSGVVTLPPLDGGREPPTRTARRSWGDAPPGGGAKQAEGSWQSQWHVRGWSANSAASFPPWHSCHTPVLSSSLAQLGTQETHRLNVPEVT